MVFLPEHWRDAISWLAYSLLGIGFPVLLTTAILAAMKLSITVGVFTNDGQIAIYSAALWATICYLLVKPATLRLPATQLIGWFTLIGFGLAVALFVIATLYSNGVDIDSRLIEWPSVALFGISVIFTFFAVGLDNKRTAFDPQSRRQADFQTLSDEFGTVDE